jgi:IS30 family transposase
MENRSEYFGVYPNTSDSSKGEVPFRAAIKTRRNGKENWINLGYTKTEKVAARVYNMYAICFFGKSAIINDVALNLDEQAEFEAFVHSTEKRQQRLAEARDRAHAVLDGGHQFRKHSDVRDEQRAREYAAEQAAAAASDALQPELPGVV